MPTRHLPLRTQASLFLIAGGLALPLGGAQAVEDTAAPSDKPVTHATESVESCMRKWDPGTHMTKASWRETCLRIKKERERFVRER